MPFLFLFNERLPKIGCEAVTRNLYLQFISSCNSIFLSYKSTEIVRFYFVSEHSTFVCFFSFKIGHINIFFAKNLSVLRASLVNI